MQLNDRAAQIVTDGSAVNNPGGRGGIAVVVRYPYFLQRPDEVICEIGYRGSTNNRMEMLACIKALEWVRKNKPWPDVTFVQIVTDSKYVADNVGYRAFGWRKNKWRNQHGEPKENADLWKKLLSARQKAGIPVEFVQTKGKKSDILKLVDRTAKEARDSGVEIDRGYRPGTVSRSMVKGGAKPYPASGQVALIRPYRKTLMATGEEKIRFEWTILRRLFLCICDDQSWRQGFTDSTVIECGLTAIQNIRRFWSALKKCHSQINTHQELPYPNKFVPRCLTALCHVRSCSVFFSSFGAGACWLFDPVPSCVFHDVKTSYKTRR